MIKARPVAGSLALGEDLLQRLKPFIYRRYLDFGMIEDIKIMKQKINAGLGREQEGERNLKLGRGGIREIEFLFRLNSWSMPGASLNYSCAIRLKCWRRWKKMS